MEFRGACGQPVFVEACPGQLSAGGLRTLLDQLTRCGQGNTVSEVCRVVTHRFGGPSRGMRRDELGCVATELRFATDLAALGWPDSDPVRG
jgi:hypothetical protein